MNDVNDFLKESRIEGYPVATFETVGDRVAGTIKGLPRVIENHLGKALVIDLANPDVSEGGRTLFAKQGQIAAAIGAACGDDGLAEGGKLVVVLVDLKDTGKGNPLKVYDARYEPPRPKVDIGRLFGDQA